ncbi:hypothetical protein VN12_26060 [Pirellula sp. SH-Sr6A]|uniref:hypothetical protein n=1 Tax=Pirellula sp. SH-Sr6A TaxID=1632865 RepID=UPI00078B2DED|nr:hypothetical protein [Pirellula sp. SH-Sr6A]AMV35584.1 hypothetical protein VN12_26060 [Pirellula sp. SH-Sr6A]
MSEILFESPLLVLGFGVLFTIIAGYAWIQTGNPWARNIAAGIAMLTILLVWLGYSVQTDRERVIEMLQDAAAELQGNEVAKIRARVHPNATETVRNALNRLDSVHFSVARVSKIHNVEIRRGATLTAQVRMNVFVEVESQGFEAKTPRWILLDLEEHEGQWKVIHFEHRNPQHEFVGGEANDIPFPSLND